MQIEHDQLTLNTESDVEQKVLMPLLAGPSYLGIAQAAIFTKQYLAPSLLDKAAGRRSGYVPDYSIWMLGFPVMVVEAKAPDVSSETGYREASLYARHLNQAYPTNTNPCRFLMASNGRTLVFGYWDTEPILQIDVVDLRPGTARLIALQDKCGDQVLRDHAAKCLQEVRAGRATYPYVIAGGSALLKAKLPPNTFAADLSPILRRYFSSAHQDNLREIVERAYVNSAEITEYDRILQALLKDRISDRRGPLSQQLEPGKRGEEHIERAISEFYRTRPSGGQLQIIQGAVGSGKSLFMRRYKEVLLPEKLSALTRWAFVDFNVSPAELARAEGWLCRSFIEAFEGENPGIDLYSAGVLRGLFSRNLVRRKGYYEELNRISSEKAALERAADLAKWREDPEETARGIADYILGSRHELLIVVMDNVDRLDLKNQLDAFQITLWFMGLTRCFIILQMRDETYERYKNRPPLDTFRTGITFHITPPRFIDVVKRRLELSLEYLEANAQSTQRYAVETGLRVSYPKSEIAEFMRLLYAELFDRKRNVSRLMEAIAGWDVRRALEMFVSMVTSGHFSETVITSKLLSRGQASISEYLLLRILMRTEYRFFSDHSGFVSNIFGCNPDWDKPDNFLLVEILYFLALNRKKVGQIGLEGYFTCEAVASELQHYGYTSADVLRALNVLLGWKLIGADHMNFSEVASDDSVRVLASGYMHVRILAGRIEYLYGVLPTTPIFERNVAEELSTFVAHETVRSISGYQMVTAVEMFYDYLVRQRMANSTPFMAGRTTGADYVLKQISGALQHFRNAKRGMATDPDPLDF